VEIEGAIGPILIKKHVKQELTLMELKLMLVPQIVDNVGKMFIQEKVHGVKQIVWQTTAPLNTTQPVAEMALDTRL